MLRLDDPQPGSREFGYVRAALENDELVVIPTDTIYGIAALATSREACGRLYMVKGRPAGQPTAVLFADIDQLVDTVDGLSLRARIACEALLPGPYTLIVRNPEGRLPWLCGDTPDVIGLRVPTDAFDLPPLAATSANLRGETEIEVLAALPDAISAQVACAIDRGPLPAGNGSTVVDLQAWEMGGDALLLRDPAGRAETLHAQLERVGRAGL